MPRGAEEISVVSRYRWASSLLGRGLLVALLLLPFRPLPCRANLVDYLQLPQIFPAHDLIVVKGEYPEWKKEWDDGRRRVRAGEFREAVESYRRLLAVKANAEEARWELALLLARLEEWEKARPELELLAEAAPDNLDYLNVLGLALRRTGQSGRALEIFNKVRGRSPENFIALVGEAQGLLELGRKREALPLIQLVAAKNPEDRDLNLAVVSLAFELGQLETARKYLMPLLGARKVDPEVLVQAARVHDGLGREKEGAGYWERVLALDSANREARERLVRYYEELGQPDKVLVHLQALWENEPKNLALLHRICRIYAKSAPFAAGLPFFEQYIRLRTDDLDFVRLLLNHQAATDDERGAFLRWLLTEIPAGLDILHGLTAGLVREDKPAAALAVWEQVARVAPERLEVFRALAPLLEKLGQGPRLLEVLETIHRLAPDDQAVIGRLARLRVERGELREGLTFYNRLEQTGYVGSDLYAERAALYEQLRQPGLALADYQRLLAIAPERQDIRRRGLSLAGEIGAVGGLASLAAGLENGVVGQERWSFLLLLADSYARAGDADRAAGSYRRILLAGEGEGGGSPGVAAEVPATDLVRQARLGLSDLYRREGLLFEAEQVLRQGLLVEVGQEDLLRRLFEMAVTAVPADSDSAAVWLDQYSLYSQGHLNELVIMQARLLAAAGENVAARELLRGLLDEAAGGGLADPEAQLVRQAGLALIEVLVGAGETAAAEQQGLVMLQGHADQEVLVRLAKIYLGVGEAKAAVKILQRLTESEDDGLRLLDLAELLRQHGLADGQFTVADRVWGRWPESFRAGFLRADALLRQGRLAEALTASVALGETFPEVTAVTVLQARINFQAGFYRQAAALCERLLTEAPGRLDIQLLRVRSEMALGNPATATRLVQALYPVAGGQFLKALLGEAGLPLPTPRHKRSLWQILTFQNDTFDLVQEVLSARAFCESTPESRKLNGLVTGVSARLRWEKSFRAALVGG